MLDEAFSYLTPSSHHDFITGTAPDDVFHGEQVGYLRQAVHLGQDAVDFGLKHIVQWLRIPLNQGEVGVAVLNSLGFARNSSTLIFKSSISGVQAFSLSDALYPVQLIAPGTYATHVPLVHFNLSPPTNLPLILGRGVFFFSF